MGFSFFYGKQDRLREREKNAYRNGFVSGVILNAVLLARRQIRLHRRGRPRDADDAELKLGRYKCPEKSGANRPAGTREALPGTKVLSKRWNV